MMQNVGASASGQDVLMAPMPQRALGRTGWQASLLTLGGVKWDGFLPESEAVRLIHRALELGLNTFDTAAGYSGGESERRLGLALDGRRDGVWISTKTGQRDYDSARRDMDASLQRLRTDHVDLMFVHGLSDDADYRKVMAPSSVLKALEEYRKAGHIRFIGVSGHHYRDNLRRIVQEYPFDAVLCPLGLFNVAYQYSYADTVLPAAQERGMAILGMKVCGAGRVKHAASVEPYLRYSLNLPLATAVIGCDSVAQLEQLVCIVKSQPPALSEQEQAALLPEALRITEHWDRGEFNWVHHYRQQASRGAERP